MSSSKLQQRNNASADVTKCIEEINWLRSELSKVKAEVLHDKDSLQRDMRRLTSDVSNTAKSLINHYNENIGKEIDKLRTTTKDDNTERTKKINNKMSEFETLNNTKYADLQKFCLELNSEQMAKVDKRFQEMKEEIRKMHFDFTEENSKLKALIEVLKKRCGSIKNDLSELSTKLAEEETQRQSVESNLDKQKNDLSEIIENLRKHAEKITNENVSEIYVLKNKSDDFQKGFTDWEAAKKQITTSINETKTKREELSNDLDEAKKSTLQNIQSMETKLAILEETIDRKFHDHSDKQADKIDQVRKDYSSEFEGLKTSMDKIGQLLTGKFSNDLESTRRATQDVMEEVKFFKDKQSNIEANLYDLDKKMIKKHDETMNGIRKMYDEYHNTQLEVQRLGGLVHNHRVKRQVSEILSGNRTPQNETGEFCHNGDSETDC